MRLRATLISAGCLGLFLTSAAWAQAQPAAQPAGPATEQAKTDEPAPRLVLSQSEWDFGTKWSGEPCTHEITITNAGNADLKILNIRTSCGCTVAQPKRRTLAPGESDAMTLTYNTKKNKKEVKQSITIETNDPTQPRTVVTVKGVVLQVFEGKPSERISFGRIEREAAETRTIELTSNRDEPVHLKLGALDDTTRFDVKLETIEAGKVYKLTATTKPPLRIGGNSLNVTLETDYAEFPKLIVPINAYVSPRITIAPARLWYNPRMDREFQRIVRVSYPSNQVLNIKEIKVSHPDVLKAELMPAPENAPVQATRSFHQIRVTLPAADKMPANGAEIVILTDDKDAEYQTLTIPIMKQNARTPNQRRINATPKKLAAPTKPDEENVDEQGEEDGEEEMEPEEE